MTRVREELAPFVLLARIVVLGLIAAALDRVWPERKP